MTNILNFKMQLTLFLPHIDADLHLFANEKKEGLSIRTLCLELGYYVLLTTYKAAITPENVDSSKIEIYCEYYFISRNRSQTIQQCL